MRTGYIYGLRDPRNGNTYYVGKTDNLQRRLREHLGWSSSDRTRKWVDELKSINLQPEIYVLEEIDMAYGDQRERYWIDLMIERGYHLLNGRNRTQRYQEPPRAPLIEQYLTIKQVAEMLHTTERAIKDDIQAGRIRAVRIGALTRIPASAVHK